MQLEEGDERSVVWTALGKAIPDGYRLRRADFCGMSEQRNASTLAARPKGRINLSGSRRATKNAFRVTKVPVVTYTFNGSMLSKSSSPKPEERKIHISADTAGHAPPGFLASVALLVQVHRQRLLAYARRRGLEAEDALDAVQDSFMAFLRLPEAAAIAYAPEESLKLLTVLLRHNVANHRRKRGRRRRAQVLLEASSTEPGTPPVDVLVTRAEELARARGCILRMAAVQRRVIMLSLLDDLPRQEVARTLGISEGYARVLLHRAREHLRRCSEDDDLVFDEPNELV